jgi:preprotein translocase subunit SecA
MGRIDTESVRFLFLVRPAEGERPSNPSAGPEETSRPKQLEIQQRIERRQQRTQQNLQYQAGPAQAETPKPVRAGAKVGRNDPCPCGSGKKYKKCHGATV